MNFNSSTIKIYPAANRNASYDYSANLNTEQNITNLSNNIVDYKNYIISGLNLDIQAVTEDSETVEYLMVSPGKCCIQGYNIEITSKNSYIKTIAVSRTPKLVYLSIDISSHVLTSGNKITQLDGYDDETTNTYTGLSIGLYDQHPTSFDNVLYLGAISYDSVKNKWVIIPEVKGKKIKANNTQIILNQTTGLVKDSFNGSFENWLKESFIIDDGEI